MAKTQTEFPFGPCGPQTAPQQLPEKPARDGSIAVEAPPTYPPARTGAKERLGDNPLGCSGYGMPQGFALNEKPVRPRAGVKKSDLPPEICPTCGAHRPVVYDRKLDATLARVLFWMGRYFRRNAGEKAIHVPSLIAGQDVDDRVKAGANGVACKLAYWGLIEHAPGRVLFAENDYGTDRVYADWAVTNEALDA